MLHLQRSPQDGGGLNQACPLGQAQANQPITIFAHRPATAGLKPIDIQIQTLGGSSLMRGDDGLGLLHHWLTAPRVTHRDLALVGQR
jgi:hypothetical protein